MPYCITSLFVIFKMITLDTSVVRIRRIICNDKSKQQATQTAKICNNRCDRRILVRLELTKLTFFHYCYYYSSD